MKSKNIPLLLMALTIVAVISISGCVQQPSQVGVTNQTTNPVLEDFKPTSGIVFVTNLGIYFMDENGGNVRRLSPRYEDEQGDDQPSVSSDGTKIVFTNAKGWSSLWIMNIDGTDRTMLVDGTNGNTYMPTWSPDGKKIIYSKSIDAGEYLFSINSDGMGEMQLTPPYPKYDPDDRWPSVSPDGTKIAFTTNRKFPNKGPDGESMLDGMCSIMIMNTDGSGMTPLETGTWKRDDAGNFYYDGWSCVNVGGSSAPGVSWSPDGSKIAFSGYPPTGKVGEGVPQIYVINSDGTGITQLTFDTTSGSHGPSWSPDGTKIAFWKVKSDSFSAIGKIYIMNSDGSSQKELAIQMDTVVGEYPTFLKKPR